MTASNAGRTRTSHVIRIIGFAALAAATLGGVGCGSSSGPEHYDPQLFTWSGPLSAEGLVELRSMNGSIEVKPATDGIVRVEASARWHKGDPKRDLDFVVANENSTIRICVLWTKGECTSRRFSRSSSFKFSFLRNRGTDANVTLTVYVPTSVRVDAITVNGSVNVAATAPVTARTVNGTVRVATAVGPVTGETVNGNVDVRMTSLGADGPVRAVTVNGSASAYLPNNTDATVKVAALNGSVSSDFTVAAQAGEPSRRSIKGNIGAGGRVVEVEALNGSAKLHMLNPDGTVLAPVSAKPVAP